MTDLISRADAIEAVRKVVIDNDAVNALNALPSAEIPTESTNTPTNTPTDLISRADAIDMVWKLDKEATEYVMDDTHEIHGYCTAIGVCVGELSALPSADAVEVVRCKDCKHKYVSGNGTTQYYVCDFMDAQYEDDGFCHHGESEVEE